MKKEVLFLIDGNSLVSTCFFGNLPREYKFARTDEEKEKAAEKILKLSNGQPINAVFTMTKKIEDILRVVNPKYMCLAWDISRNTFRRKIDPNYKAQRKSTNTYLKSQIPIAQDFYKELGLKNLSLQEFEADDIIGTLSKNLSKDISVIILTKDQDALQLIDERISVWLMTSKADDLYAARGINQKDFNIINGVFCYTPLTLKEEYGLNAKQIIDFKSISGDAGDNIPGISGVGEKTSIPLIQEFDTLENIYDFIEGDTEKDVKALAKEIGITRLPLKAFKEQKDNAFMSKKLATICTTIPEIQEFSLEDFIVNIDYEKKKELYLKYEFKSLIKE